MLRVHVPTSFPEERKYVLHVLLGEFLGLDWELAGAEGPTVVIAGEDGRRLELADGLFATPAKQWLTPGSVPGGPFTWIETDELPGNPRLEPSRLPAITPAAHWDSALVEVSEDKIRLGIDLLGGAFFMLSRYEEYVGTTRDQHDRFAGVASVLNRDGLLTRPLVNEYLEVLWACLAQLWPQLQRKQRRYRLLLSHDVDRPFTARVGIPTLIRQCGGDVLIQRKPVFALRRLVSYPYRKYRVHRWDPHDTFQFIQDTERAMNVSSVFNFMTYQSPRPVDGDYDLDHPWIRSLIRHLAQAGHEIGLHTSFDTYLDRQRTVQEAADLRQAAEDLGVTQQAWGGRQHYLRFSNPETWQNWEAAGMDYDSTMGFHDRVGFRCGTCYEYPVFDLKEKKQLALRERPLTVMEGTLFRAMGLTDGESLDSIRALARTCRFYLGDFSLLWHNNLLMDLEQRMLYKTALQETRA